MPTLAEIVVHGVLTERGGRQYQFTPKHHGADRNAAQWLPELTLDEEFLTFDTADRWELADEDGRLFGILPGLDGLRFLGTWLQQMAEFPHARDDEPWHGYPLYPLVDFGPENRRGERCRPAKVVFDQMRDAGLITRAQRKRLLKGVHA